MFYEHERTEREASSDAMNTVWPAFCDNGRAVDQAREYLNDRELDWDLAEENGWYVSKGADMFGNLRIVIPAKCTKPGHVYWQARAIDPNVKLRYTSPKGLRHDALVWINAYPNEDETDQVVIVEGPMDALAAACAGFDAIALMGITPPDSTLDVLAKIVNKRRCLVLLDSEPAAQGAAIRIVMRLASQGGKAGLTTLGTLGKDLAACSPEQRLNFLDRAFNAMERRQWHWQPKPSLLKSA